MAKKTSKTVSDKAVSDTSGSSSKAAPAATSASGGSVASADTDKTIFIGKGDQSAFLTLGLANRHGLVTGATGTGK
ncbi:MAG TPA: ATPase, partial [Afipia sp.]|nr:ATPase [Afipia sp.]